MRDSQGTEHMAALAQGILPPGDLPSQNVIEEQTESNVNMTGSQHGMRTFDSGKSDLIKVVSVSQLNKEVHGRNDGPSDLLNRISESHESHYSPKGKYRVPRKIVQKKGKNHDLIKHNKLVINSEESLTQSYEQLDQEIQLKPDKSPEEQTRTQKAADRREIPLNNSSGARNSPGITAFTPDSEEPKNDSMKDDQNALFSFE